MTFTAQFKKYLHIWLMLLGLAIGLLATALIVHNKDIEMRQNLLSQVEVVELSLDWDNVYDATQAVKKADHSEYVNILYNQTRAQMAKLCSIQDKCRAIYLMQQNAKKQLYFVLDSSPTSSEFYIEPGTVYDEATEPILEAYRTKKSAIDNPATDKYGYWQNAYAPHTLPDGSLVLLGMDVEASQWNITLWTAAVVPLLATFAFLGLLMFYTFMWQSKHKQNEQLLKMQVELFKLSNEDSLTRLPNRRLFEDRLERLISSTERTEQKFTLIYLDLDGFKNINDTLGHQAGDQLLAVVAERLTMICRLEDTAARLSGDEFALLLPRVGSVKDAELVAQKIINAISVPITLQNNEVVVTGSLGIAIYAADYHSADKLFCAADKALYQAKSNGKNRYYFAEEMAASAVNFANNST